MTRYVDRDKLIPPGSVLIPEWLLKHFIETMERSAAAHHVVATTYPSEVEKAPTGWGARMGEATICAAYLRCAIEQLQALKGQE